MKLQVLAAFIFTLYIAVTGALFVFQRSLLYPAPQAFRETPADRGLAFEEINLDTGGGETTHAWFIPAENAKGVALYSHGNGDNVGTSMDEAEFLHSMGFAVMLYDYGGYGLSSGSPSEERNYADGRAAWNYLTQERGVPADRIVLVGVSLGGGISSQLALENTPAALVLEATFTSIPDAARLRFPLINFEKIILDKYENLKKIPKINAPIMVLHSINDGTVPYQLGETLYKAANEPRKLVELEDGHARGMRDEREAYTAAWREFIDPLFEGKPPLNFAAK